MASDPIRVVHFGLGPIGQGILHAVLERPDLALVGVVDVDPKKAGRDAGEIVGRDPSGVRVDADAASLLSRVEADVAIVATTSKLADQERLLLDLVGRGLSVVSTCEELAFPWKRHHAIACRIDEAARAAARSVLGTGVNPGFLMDHVPLVLSGAMKNVHSVRVERIQDAARRRRPFQEKVGVGRAEDEFRAAHAAGKAGHVGLAESVEMLGHALGFALDRVEESFLPLVATRRLEHQGVVVEPGQVYGVEQVGRGLSGAAERVTLVFRAAFLEPDPVDRVVLGGDPPLEASFPGGVPGDVATVALVVNAVPAILRARPGLRTMAEMQPLASRCF